MHSICRSYWDQKPNVLSAKEEALLAARNIRGSYKISESLQDADMTFESVTDSNGEVHELNQSNYVLFTDEWMTHLDSSFKSFYKGSNSILIPLHLHIMHVLKEAVAEAQVRHYESSRAMSMAYEHVPGVVW